MFVTGCHRSGTSLLAGLLHDLAVGEHSIASPQLETKLENPLGFFESRRLVALNDELLRSAGAFWNQPPLLLPLWSASPLFETLIPLRARLASYALSQDWVDKDPRLCITYPAFQHLLLKRVPLAASLRQPLDVATSLRARDGLSLEAGLALWYIYNHHLASFIEEDDLLFNYQSLLSLRHDPDASLAVYRALAALFERQSRQPVLYQHWERILAERLRPDFNRASFSLPSRLTAHLNPDLMRVCSLAMSRTLNSERLIPAYQQAFADLPRPVLDAARHHRLFAQAPCSQDDSVPSAEHHAVCDDLARSQSLVRDLQDRLSAVEASHTWRLTAPLRRWKDSWLHRSGA